VTMVADIDARLTNREGQRQYRGHATQDLGYDADPGQP
jgi:hypothetical protein